MATQPVPNHDELVEVFESMEESEAQVVHGLLESVGIDSIVFSREAPQDVLPGVGGVAVKVRSGRGSTPHHRRLSQQPSRRLRNHRSGGATDGRAVTLFPSR